jgi:hypothetical protein
MALDASGLPMVAFRDGNNQSIKIAVAVPEASVWGLLSATGALAVTLMKRFQRATMRAL